MANVICPSCGAAGRIPDNLMGRRIKCPKCQEPFTAAVAPAKPAAPPSRPAAGSPAKPARGPVKPAASSPRGAAPPPPPAEEEDVLEELPEEDGVALDDAPVGSGGAIDYLRPFRYVFEKPRWFKNALLTGLCGLIPVVGPLCVMGYGYEVVLRLHCKGRDSSYPDFDFGRFGAYLMRGLWPAFFGALGMLAVMVPVWGVSVVLTLALASHGPGILLSLLELVLAAVFLVLMILLLPMCLRAGLSLSFDIGGGIRFTRDFLKRVGAPMVLGLLVVGFLGGLLNMAGALVCCVGTLVTSPIVTLAYANLFYQLYELHLARGGQAIPVKESAA